MTTHETMTATEAAAAFVQLLENNHWKLSLSPRAELVVIVGNDDPPRWPQGKIFATLDAMAPSIIALVAERDGLAGLGDEGTAH